MEGTELFKQDGFESKGWPPPVIVEVFVGSATTSLSQSLRILLAEVSNILSRLSVVVSRHFVVVVSSISMHDIITVLSFLFIIEASPISELFNPVSKYKLPCFLASVLRVCQNVHSNNVKLSVTPERDSQVQPPEMSAIPERDLQVKPPKIQVTSAGSG